MKQPRTSPPKFVTRTLFFTIHYKFNAWIPCLKLRWVLGREGQIKLLFQLVPPIGNIISARIPYRAKTDAGVVIFANLIHTGAIWAAAVCIFGCELYQLLVGERVRVCAGATRLQVLRLANASIGTGFCVAIFVVGWIVKSYYYLFFFLEALGGITAPLVLLLISFEAPPEGFTELLKGASGDESLGACELPAAVIGADLEDIASDRDESCALYSMAE